MAIIREGKVLYFVMHDIKEFKKKSFAQGRIFPPKKGKGGRRYIYIPFLHASDHGTAGRGITNLDTGYQAILF